MKEISFIIPFRTDEGVRERNLRWNVDRLKVFFPEAEIIIEDSKTEAFNRSEARNNAARQATREYAVQVDSDTVWNEEALHQALDRLNNGAPWVIAYKDYWALDPTSTAHLVELNHDVYLKHTDYNYSIIQENTPAIGGFLVLRRDDLFRVGGWDERFLGWGWEDNAFALAADTILGPHERLDQSIYHLWHPIGETIEHEHYQDNVRLFQSYANQFKLTHTRGLNEI